MFYNICSNSSVVICSVKDPSSRAFSTSVLSMTPRIFVPVKLRVEVEHLALSATSLAFGPSIVWARQTNDPLIKHTVHHVNVLKSHTIYAALFSKLLLIPSYLTAFVLLFPHLLRVNGNPNGHHTRDHKETWQSNSSTLDEVLFGLNRFIICSF